MESASAPAGNAPAPAPTTALATPIPEAPAAKAPEGPSNSYPATDWRHTLPDDVREEASLKLMQDVPSLAKSYLHAQKMVGANKVPLPGKHATEDDIQRFYDQIGRPALDKYEVKAPKDAKFVDDGFLKELIPIAHKSGVLPAQLEKILSWYEEKAGASATAHKAQVEVQTKEQLGGLQKEWGKAYDQKLGYAKHLLKEKGDPTLMNWLEQTGAGNSPEVIKFLAKLGEDLYKEDNIVNGVPAGKNLYSPSEAMKQANNIMADAAHPYNNPAHPNHAAAVREVSDLFQMAYPGEPSKG